jgi:hypothetical protein
VVSAVDVIVEFAASASVALFRAMLDVVLQGDQSDLMWD